MRKIIAAVMLVVTIFSLTSCELLLGLGFLGWGIHDSHHPTNKATGSDVAINSQNECYALTEQGKTKEVVYIPDEFQGNPIEVLGTKRTYYESFAEFNSEVLKKIYVPWTVNEINTYVMYGVLSSDSEIDTNVDIISATTQIIPGEYRSAYDNYKNDRFVIPNALYEDVEEDGYIGIRGEGGFTMETTVIDRCIPANISYLFNYNENPNKGYFFVDLLEETGKITKPPYDPKREGYTFSGWYTDKECTEAFDFDKDQIMISFDGEGNRVYEEFCLYAKWR